MWSLEVSGQGRAGEEHFLDRGRKGRRKIGWKEGKGGQDKKRNWKRQKLKFRKEKRREK